jgi:hypothetical protein
MAEHDNEDRTERASPKRLEDARKKGQVPRSRELAAAAVTLAGGTALYMMGGALASRMHTLMGATLAISRDEAMDESVMVPVLERAFLDALLACAPILGVILAAALLAPLAMGSITFSTSALMPDFSRLNPLAGIGRMFSVNSVMELTKALAKFGVVGLVAVLVLWNDTAMLIGLGREPIPLAISHAFTRPRGGDAELATEHGVPLLAVLAMLYVPRCRCRRCARRPVHLQHRAVAGLAVLAMLPPMAVCSSHAKRPLDFAAFPTVLLLATLLRLALNVASTRVVLLHGHSGHGGRTGHRVLRRVRRRRQLRGRRRRVRDPDHHQLRRGDQGRRPHLGGQRAFHPRCHARQADGDRCRPERRHHRPGARPQAAAREVVRGADFYGSMDGASKFVRGDATAGILVLVINIVGGLAIGMMQHDMPFGQAANYTLLTIGDGLVAQIPALLLSTAVASISPDRTRRHHRPVGSTRRQGNGHQSRPGLRPAAWHRDPRPGIRPGSGVDRRRSTRAGAVAGLHGGGRQHRHRHPSEPGSCTKTHTRSLVTRKHRNCSTAWASRRRS